MSDLGVPRPILNSPYEEPSAHWHLVHGEPAERREGRRIPVYHYRPPSTTSDDDSGGDPGTTIELKLVTLIRERVKQWRESGRWRNEVTRTTLELLDYWRRDGREEPLFFAQLEAVETIIFLVEAARDHVQGIRIPMDEPSPQAAEQGVKAFIRHACKMATGTGKTTVMGMLSAWSILNKARHRGDKRFSDVVLVVCPNVTIRSRLEELKPEHGETSIYRTRDLVPAHLMPELRRGRVLVTNWHVFELQKASVGGSTSRVVKAGRERMTSEIVILSDKTATLRGKRYLRREDYDNQVAAGVLEVVEEITGRSGDLERVRVKRREYVESDTALLRRVFGNDAKHKRNILVFNDEAHHAYRLHRDEPDEWEAGDEDDDEEAEEFYKEATIWVEGLDVIHRHRGINLCVDLSATPYFLGRVGPMSNRPFPWVVSDFGLTDAIESGLVKIPQLAVRDSSGAEIPGYFNIWKWILPRLSPADRGGKRAAVRPEAVLKWANVPLAIMCGLWDRLREEWASARDDGREPVIIIVCKNTKLARLVHEWIGEDNPPYGIPRAGIPSLVNTPSRIATIRVDSKVVHETDSGAAKDDETRWMRATLDTVGKRVWPTDAADMPVHPERFVELAAKLGRPLHPPGRDVRCIVSVGMLTEGWDCRTVTHVVGLRPFMSQLLCEQVVGRALRRTSYDVGPDGLMSEEIAKILGVPFHTVPLKAVDKGPDKPPVRRWHVHAMPQREALRIEFPRVEGYTQVVREHVAVNWDRVPTVVLDPLRVPPSVLLKAHLGPVQTGSSMLGPGSASEASLATIARPRRLQRVAFELATDLLERVRESGSVIAPPHAVFARVLCIVETCLATRVQPIPPYELAHAGYSPFFQEVLDALEPAIESDPGSGEAIELPRFEASRGPGSTSDVDFWTTRDVRETLRSHVNFVVADTQVWEQAAAYALDTHRAVDAWVKNAGLGFAIPYLHDGRAHDYLPDFLVRSKHDPARMLILETKGHDPLAEVKKAAALRWVSAVNGCGRHGTWSYALARHPADAAPLIAEHFGA